MKKLSKLLFSCVVISALCTSCQRVEETTTTETTANSYLNYKTPGEVQTGGIQMIPLKEGYKVWTKRFGNSPTMKVLLLHGGPAMTHEYMEAFESFFPEANIEFYEYDQLGSYYSDQPEDMSLYNIDRFVEEVEQVRQHLGLDESNFYILGNSWGGMLAMEYALKHQDKLKGLIISNMTASFPKYAVYNAKLRSEMRPSLIDSLEVYEQRSDFMNPEYQALVYENYYKKHLCRLEDWPDPVNRSFKHVNQKVYEYMQGPSEFVPGGILQNWDRWDDLKQLTVPTLTVGAKYDTMNPEEMKEMSQLVQNGQYLYCPNGSHLAMWDDQQVFMDGVIKFIKDVDAAQAKSKTAM
ncbi:alpha/beta fold hydrolase [Pontibacter diazotrophicus]|uniref:Alpha/beta fold hydrolase n=1 Tax=Pontibacter diazotrophicus TaxID=1400979 RepID=A0A3D8LF21_9BACT|nr:proline iminopeptidase-family hydrolase [Pontibacter diazotrophicus]RDV15896.1 alpha/beta fold hydrolase [Pontibacter diazotrophicus]